MVSTPPKWHSNRKMIEKVSQLARCSFIADAKKTSHNHTNEVVPCLLQVKVWETSALRLSPRTGSGSPAAKSLRGGNGGEPFRLTSQIGSGPQRTSKKDITVGFWGLSKMHLCICTLGCSMFFFRLGLFLWNNLIGLVMTLMEGRWWQPDDDRFDYMIVQAPDTFHSSQ